MKKCPYCAEEIQEEAIKCKHCHEFLDGSAPPRVNDPRSPDKKLPWYFGSMGIVVGLLTIGPLALPLVWAHPNLKLLWKIIITVAVIVATWYLVQLTLYFIKTFSDVVREEMKILNI